jgi:elongation factor G
VWYRAGQHRGNYLSNDTRLPPSPEEKEVKLADDSAVKELKVDENETLAALVFKTSADPYVGKLSMFRVYSGHIDSNSQVWNVNQGANERIGQIFIPRGKNQETVAHIPTDILGQFPNCSNRHR